MARLRLAGLALVVALGALPRADAQFARRTAPVAAPPTSLVAPGDALAVGLDPADLALLDGWGLTYAHARAPQGVADVLAGDGVYFATPLPLGLGVGLAVERLRATPGVASVASGRVAFALAWSADPRVAVGTTVRWIGAPGDPIDGTTTVDLAWTARPTERLGLALLIHDVFGPLGLVGGGAAELPATFVVAAALRPWGDDTFTLEAAFGADTDGLLGVRGLAALSIPRFGRITALAEGNDLGGASSVRFLAGLDVLLGSAGVSGGVIGGQGFGSDVGWYLAARVGGVTREGLPTPGFVLDLPLEGSLGPRGILGAVAALDRAARDRRVVGVVLRPRDTGIGLAYAQEVRERIAALRAAGKPVICHLDAASGSELYACAAATAVLVDPAGAIELIGTSVDVISLGQLLHDVGIRADFVRVGSYKSAVEQATNERMSEAAREQREALLTDAHHRLSVDLAEDLGTSPAEARRLIDEGPYLAEQAVAVGLAGAEADARVLAEPLEEAFGRRHPLRARFPNDARVVWGVPRRVGVLVIDGALVDGENVDVPILEVHQSGAQTVVDALERLVADPTVASIVVRVDSPGGSALASDQIWRAVRRARERKPVIASLGAVAASGGYYVASAADEIWAEPSTLTGSIGVFFGKVDFAPLAERVGVHVEQLARGRHAGADSLFRAFTPEEREVLADLIRRTYRLFLRRVAEGRGMDVDAVHRLGEGRVFTGEAAARRGLVDHVGGFGAALERARALGRVAPDAPLAIVPGRPETLLDYVTGGLGDGTGSRGRARVSPTWARAAGWASVVGHTRAGVALAMDPFVVAPL